MLVCSMCASREYDCGVCSRGELCAPPLCVNVYSVMVEREAWFSFFTHLLLVR